MHRPQAKQPMGQPAPIARAHLVSHEDAAAFIAAGIALAIGLAGLLAWVAGGIGALLTHGRWPSLPVTDSLFLLWGIISNPHSPALAWPGVDRRQLAPAGVFWILYAVLVCTVLVGITRCLVVVQRRRRRRRTISRRRERDHSAAWAQPRDVKPLQISSMRELRGRVFLGVPAKKSSPMLATPRFTSLAVIAPTGSAKTAKYVVPTILRWSDAILVTSTKSDVADLTIDYRAEKLGRPAFIFDPLGEWPKDRQKFLCAWSPLMEVETYADAEKVAEWLAESVDANADPKIRVFISMTLIALAPLLWIARRRDKTMQDISDWIASGSLDEPEELLTEYRNSSAFPAQEESDWQAARRAITATKHRNSNWYGIICGNADFILKAFTSAQMAATTEILFDQQGKPYSPFGRRVLDMNQVLDEGGTIYVVSDEEEQEILKPVFQCVAQSYLRACRKRQRRLGAGPLQNPPMLMLEEAANVAPLPTLDKMAATYRGYGIVIVSIWQDEAQVGTIYGERASTVLGNHTTRVYLPGSSDDQTLERISRLIGDQPITAQSASASQSEAGTTVSYMEGTEDVRVAPIDYLRTLPQNTAIAMSGRFPPIQISSLPWFQDSEMRSRIGPEVCERYDRAFG